MADSTEIYCFTVLEAGSLKLRCWQSWFVLKAVRENLFHVLFLDSGGLLAITGVPWFIEASSRSRPSSSHGILPVSMSVTDCILISPFYGHQSYCIKTYSNDLILTRSSAKILFPNKVTFTGTRTSTSFGGTQFNP